MKNRKRDKNERKKSPTVAAVRDSICYSFGMNGKMALNAKLKQAMQIPLYHFIPEFSMKERNDIMAEGVRKRGKTWSYYFDTAKINGERNKIEKGGFKTQKEALDARAAAIAEYNNTGRAFSPKEIFDC